MAFKLSYSIKKYIYLKWTFLDFIILSYVILENIKNKRIYNNTSIYVQKKLESLYKFDHRLQLLIKECLDIKNSSKRTLFLEIVKYLMEVKKHSFKNQLTKNEKMVSNSNMSLKVNYFNNLKQKL